MMPARFMTDPRGLVAEVHASDPSCCAYDLHGWPVNWRCHQRRAPGHKYCPIHVADRQAEFDRLVKETTKEPLHVNGWPVRGGDRRLPRSLNRTPGDPWSAISSVEANETYVTGVLDYFYEEETRAYQRWEDVA
jgi:hypothetical protein